MLSLFSSGSCCRIGRGENIKPRKYSSTTLIHLYSFKSCLIFVELTIQVSQKKHPSELKCIIFKVQFSNGRFIVFLQNSVCYIIKKYGKPRDAGLCFWWKNNQDYFPIENFIVAMFLPFPHVENSDVRTLAGQLVSFFQVERERSPNSVECKMTSTLTLTKFSVPNLDLHIESSLVGMLGFIWYKSSFYN